MKRAVLNSLKRAALTWGQEFGAPWGTHRPWWPESWRRTWRMPGPSWKQKSCCSGPRRRTCWPLKLWPAGAPGTRSWRSSHSETPASTLPARGATFPPSAARWWRKPELRTADRWHKTPRSPSAAAKTSLKNACRPSVMVSQLLIALLCARLRFRPLFLPIFGGCPGWTWSPPRQRNLLPQARKEGVSSSLYTVDLQVLLWILDPGKVTVRSPAPPNLSCAGCHQGFLLLLYT